MKACEDCEIFGCEDGKIIVATMPLRSVNRTLRQYVPCKCECHA